MPSKSETNDLARYIPALFVVLWSTGFVGARYAMPYASPYGFLSLRFIGVIVLLGIYAIWTKAAWPKGMEAVWAAVVGVLIHACYLGAVFWAVKHGFPAGFAGLIVGLQPIITAVLASLVLGERITMARWVGLGVGFVGVGLVFWPKIASGAGADLFINALACFGGVVAFSLGNVIQKSKGTGGTLATGTLVQNAGALVVAVPIALLFEPLEMNWTPEFTLALLWSIIVLSIGAVILLMTMIRIGEVARVASLFYMVPVVTAAMAFVLFGETLNLVQMAGVVITSLGVALAAGRSFKTPPTTT